MKCTYENVHTRFTAILKYIVSLFSFLSLFIKTLFLLLEVVMKLNYLHNESITKCRIAEIVNDGNCDHFTLLLTGLYPLLYLDLMNFTKHNKAKSSTYMLRFKLRTILFQEVNLTTLFIETFDAKTALRPGIKVWSLGLIITIGKISTVISKQT